MMLAQMTGLAEWFEAIMLICFGLSWPTSIYKTWKVKRTDGKSLAFLALIFVGYAAGVASKFARAAGGESLEWVTGLYALNGLMVATDAVLVIRYRTAAALAGQGADRGL